MPLTNTKSSAHDSKGTFLFNTIRAKLKVIISNLFWDLYSEKQWHSCFQIPLQY